MHTDNGTVLKMLGDGHGPWTSFWDHSLTLKILKSCISKSIWHRNLKLTYNTDNGTILKMSDDGHGPVNLKVIAWPVVQ